MKILGKFPSTRLRRVRNSEWMRKLISENELSANDLILPIFVREGKNKIEKIKSMPGINRYTVDKLGLIIKKAKKLKIPMIAIFPNTPKNKKNSEGSEALNENNLICRSLKFIKKKFPKIGVMCDVALDPYTTHGHDGVIKKGKIDNDETIKILIKQSLLQAKFGCDVIAPSDMMDGRIASIRSSLEENGFVNTIILSYAAKYSSKFYGPFRDAVGSSSNLGVGSKDTYQMSPTNINEALHEVRMDLEEGADIVMVKPGMPYLDIIKSIKDKFKLPVLAYQVSGEYSLIETAISKKLINKDAVYESLVAFKRAGANAIVSYYADRLDKIIK